jgi:hypothetical protein
MASAKLDKYPKVSLLVSKEPNCQDNLESLPDEMLSSMDKLLEDQKFFDQILAFHRKQARGQKAPHVYASGAPDSSPGRSEVRQPPEKLDRRDRV